MDVRTRNGATPRYTAVLEPTATVGSSACRLKNVYTQADTRADVGLITRSVIAAMLEVIPGSFELLIVDKLPDR